MDSENKVIHVDFAPKPEPKIDPYYPFDKEFVDEIIRQDRIIRLFNYGFVLFIVLTVTYFLL